MSFDLVIATPSFLDLTVVGLEALPALGEERFAGDLLRSPGGGAITAVAATRLGLSTALVAPLGDDLAGEFVRDELEHEGVTVAGPRSPRTPQTLVMPFGDDRAMVTVDPGVRARAADVAALDPRAVAANLEQIDLVPAGRARLHHLRRRRRARVRAPPAAGARPHAGALPRPLGRAGADRREPARGRRGAARPGRSRRSS